MSQSVHIQVCSQHNVHDLPTFLFCKHWI